ncbi:MAG: hypothetical protein ACKPGX_08955, partial [Dolichospermum sp.]
YNNLLTLKVKSKLPSQCFNYPQHSLKLRFNPLFILLGIVLFSGLVVVDNLRFNSRIIKPEHRYFTDPNNYLEFKP